MINNSAKLKKELEKRKEIALLEVGFLIEGSAKLNAPVDTGKMRSEIKNLKVNDKSIIIGCNVEYAIDVEKGTKKQKAQPFLTPAYEQNQNVIRNIVGKVYK